MMNPTVIYHSADYDGIFCREIAKKFLPSATLIGWNHGDAKIPVPKEGPIYILDLSPECLAETPGGESVPFFDRMVWIDHHKSSIDKWPDSIPGYRIDGVAACRLAWQWFTNDIANNVMSDANYLPSKQSYVNRDIEEPMAVRLAGEFDIWDKRDPNAELFQMGLRSRDLDDAWGDMLDMHKSPPLVMALLQNGVSLQYAKNKENESIIKAAGFTIEFEGLKFLACNHARYNSFLFTAGLTPEHDACFGFAWRDGHWNVSLYHAPGKEHHDLSAIAVKYGGGGHRGACGFRVKTLPFLNYESHVKS